MDVTVVGSGVGGSALAREAEKRGHKVRLLGGQQKPLASLAALSIVLERYVPDPDAKEAVSYALAAYEAAGCQLVRGALVSSKQRPEGKEEPDWTAVEAAPYLVAPEAAADVPPGWKDPNADWTIHATGAGGLEGKVTFGVTWANADPRALRLEPHRLRVHRYAPYRSADAVVFRSGCRLGSSSAASVEKAREESVRIFETAKALGWIGSDSGWYQIVARRVKRDELTTLEGAGLATFGGFHRTGWSLAPLRARQLIERLEADGGVRAANKK